MFLLKNFIFVVVVHRCRRHHHHFVSVRACSRRSVLGRRSRIPEQIASAATSRLRGATRTLLLLMTFAHRGNDGRARRRRGGMITAVPVAVALIPTGAQVLILLLLILLLLLLILKLRARSLIVVVALKQRIVLGESTSER